jgi:hypothetical protein
MVRTISRTRGLLWLALGKNKKQTTNKLPAIKNLGNDKQAIDLDPENKKSITGKMLFASETVRTKETKMRKIFKKKFSNLLHVSEGGLSS